MNADTIDAAFGQLQHGTASRWPGLTKNTASAREVDMAESRRDSTHVQREAEKATEGGAQEAEKATERGVREMERATERGVELLKQQTERVEEMGREGTRRASETSAAAFREAARTGSALADAAEEIAGAWARYTEDVMRNTSQASQALLRSRSISEMLQVQVTLVHDNMRSFLDQSARVADTASRMVMRPFEVTREVSTEQAP
jgi:phasin protein